MIPVVTEKFKVQSYEGDVNRRMKPVALQQRLQEAAYVGGDFCGAAPSRISMPSLIPSAVTSATKGCWILST